MSKVAVVYWSGTGNTEAMANAVVEGAKAAGAEVELFTASEFGANKIDEFAGSKAMEIVLWLGCKNSMVFRRIS